MVEALGMVTKNLQKRRQQIGVSVYKNGIPTESGIAWNRKNFFECNVMSLCNVFI